MKKRAQLLKSYVLKKFPEVDVGFYLSCRSEFVHMGLEIMLYSIKNYPDFIDEINSLLKIWLHVLSWYFLSLFLLLRRNSIISFVGI